MSPVRLHAFTVYGILNTETVGQDLFPDMASNSVSSWADMTRFTLADKESNPFGVKAYKLENMPRTAGLQKRPNLDSSFTSSQALPIYIHAFTGEH